MAEARRSHPSQYVKLTKDQDASASGPGVEDIRPGELNLPVAVPQVGLAIPRAILVFFRLLLLRLFVRGIGMLRSDFGRSDYIAGADDVHPVWAGAA